MVKILLMFQEIYKESVAMSSDIREYLFIYEEAMGYLFITLQPIPSKFLILLQCSSVAKIDSMPSNYFSYLVSAVFP
jgi:hypothetical protein